MNTTRSRGDFMNIVVTTYFLESVFSFDAKSRRAILSTIEALDTNPKSDALKIHKFLPAHIRLRVSIKNPSLYVLNSSKLPHTLAELTGVVRAMFSFQGTGWPGNL